MEWDVFISHASEDKDSFVRNLAIELQKCGVKVFYDEFSLRLGDSLTGSIDKGLAESRYGLVVLSNHFFNKNWPKRELAGLVARETSGDERVILPLWHNITPAEIRKYSPPLADIVAVDTSKGLDYVISKILEVVLAEAKETEEESKNKQSKSEGEKKKLYTEEEWEQSQAEQLAIIIEHLQKLKVEQEARIRLEASFEQLQNEFKKLLDRQANTYTKSYDETIE